MQYLVTNQINFTDDVIDYVSISPVQALEILEKEFIWGLDTETTGMDAHSKFIKSIQIGNELDQYYLDDTVNYQYFQSFFENPNRTFVLQNAKFDLKFFYNINIVLPKVFDTYLAERLLWLGYPPGYHPMSLDHLVYSYLGHNDVDKTVRGVVLREGHSVRAINYGCLDVKYLIPLMLEQRVKLKENGLLIASGIENEFVRVLAYIEYCGIKLDVGKWQAKMKKDRDLLNEKEAILNQWILDYGDAKYIKEDNDLFEGHTVKCNINWNSSKQLIPLFETLGFNLITKDKKTGQTKKTVDAQIIKKQSDKSTIVEPYLAYSSAFKTVSTYGQTFIDHINPVTKRLHTQYNQMVDTGRLSCGGKNKDTGEEYDNLQNLPSDAETRACFVASEGHKLIDCDYTAQEDLVFTQLCQEPKLIEFYNDKTRKRDGHSFVAKICFPKDLNDVPEEEVKHVRPDLRALAKKAKFSIHYGGNGSTIAKNLGLDLEVGNAIE
jgi:DNA polymerase I-like protein with 3'-5' exonuclease and polymerase domains